jgi:septal ring factor EnvC (AmiA/AmiB activator)
MCLPRFICCLALTVACVPLALGQAETDREATERRLRDLQEQISQDQYRLSQTVEAEQASLQTLEDLNRQITVREELVRNYQLRLQQLSLESVDLTKSLSELEAELNDLKEQYQSRAEHAYKYGRMHDLALILAAESINQMLIRVRYLHRFADQRRRKLDEIESAGAALQDKRAQLQDTRAETEKLLTDAKAEQATLRDLRGERRKVVSELRAQRSTLEKEISRKTTAARQLETRIRELIAAATARRNAAPGTASAAEYAELSGSFLQNRGRLPWPSDGVVTEPFGDIVHPVYGTKTPNPGVLIATRASAEVRAVFEGTVISVSVIPAFGTYVVLEHGEYLTVYSNFSALYVTEGERVRAGQIIGRAGTDAEPKRTGVFFALFQKGSNAPLDPLPWLRPQ